MGGCEDVNCDGFLFYVLLHSSHTNTPLVVSSTLVQHSLPQSSMQRPICDLYFVHYRRLLITVDGMVYRHTHS